MDACVDIIRNHGPARLRPSDFRKSAVHSAQEIEADEQKTQETLARIRRDEETQREELFQKTDRLRAEALEIIIARMIENYLWFGDNFYFSHASHYDDLFNKVDGVLEYYDEETIREHLAVAIDATKAVDIDVVSKKIRDNTDRLIGRNGRPRSMVKYFESPKNGEQSTLFDVVPVVVGIDGKHLDELIMLFANTENLRKQMKMEPDNKTIRSNLQKKETQLTAHPAATVFMHEIMYQLQTYDRLLDTEPPSERRSAALTKIVILRSIFERALSTRPALPNEMQADRTYQTIKSIAGAHRIDRGKV